MLLSFQSSLFHVNKTLFFFFPEAILISIWMLDSVFVGASSGAECFPVLEHEIHPMGVFSSQIYGSQILVLLQFLRIWFLGEW